MYICILRIIYFFIIYIYFSKLRKNNVDQKTKPCGINKNFFYLDYVNNLF